MNNDQTEAFIQSGAEFRKRRKELGISQEDLSLEASVDQSTYSKVERLGPTAVSLPRLVRIADALDCVLEVRLRPRKTG